MRLPRLMVAPNGATKTRADHPALPLTLDEVTRTALSCQQAGAEGLHLHLRDAAGGHLLDAGAYREALAHLSAALPGMALQITTEAAGIYDPPLQRAVALESGCAMVTVALRELLRDTEEATRQFYQTCADQGIFVQHILYAREDAEALARLLPEALLQDPDLQLLFVLGRYVAGQTSTPAMLEPFTDWLAQAGIAPDWAVCAFGQGETECLLAADALGGKLRVGFENSLVDAQGLTAPDNAARVAAIRSLIA